MDHIIVGVKGLAKDPKVILVRQPIVDTNLLVWLLDCSVDDLVGAGELDPFSFRYDLYARLWVTVFNALWVFHYYLISVRLRLHHDFDVGWSGTAACVENTIFLIHVFLALKH